MSMIFAGAIGNLIDGMFYGLIFDSGMVYDSTIDRWIGYDGISQFTEFGKGYSHFMKGCVVDMFFFRCSHSIFWLESILNFFQLHF